MRPLTLSVIIFFLASCDEPKSWIHHVNGSLNPKSTLTSLDVSYYLYDDQEYGGDNAYAVQLILKNNSEEVIDNCIVLLNKKYRSKLERAEYYFGIKQGNKPLKRSYIDAGETLELIFSHDNNNYYIFQDVNGNYLPKDKRITEITVLSANGTANFAFTE